MKVLFLTQYPRQGPSSRYRVYQMVPWLEANGVECEVRSLVSEQDYGWMRGRGRYAAKTWLMGKSWVSRLIQILRSSRYDVVYVLKTAFPLGPPLFETLASRVKCPFVVDYDDAIFLHRDSVDHAFLDGFKATHHFNRILRLADGVIVPNDFLREHSLRYNQCVLKVPEAEDTERLRPRGPHRNDGDVIVGWVGSPSTASYLDLIEPALRRICSDYPQVRCRFIGGNWTAPGIRSEYVPWTLEREVENLQSLDIGLMPLTDTDWSRGKSGCKLRQYMSVGVPSVASRVGYNCELVLDRSHGLLVSNTEDEWYDALAELIESSDQRNRIACAARQRVEEEFTIEKIGPVFKEALHTVANSSQ